MTRIKTHSSILTMGDGGTWSYGGTADPLNMLPPFDKGIKLVRGRTRRRFRVRTTPGTPGSRRTERGRSGRPTAGPAGRPAPAGRLA